jgi:hypothetical protein
VAAAVVFTISVVVCAEMPLTVIEAGILQVAGPLAATGAMVQLRATAPVNPPMGVTLTVDVFPVVAPEATLTDVPEMEKLGGVGVMV